MSKGFISSVLLGACIAAAQVATSAGQPSFEVASIKLHVFSGGGHVGVSISGDRVTISALPLSGLIMSAYNVRDYQMSPEGPGWIRSDRYDIVAKVDGEGRPTMDQVRQMLQKLLADRFQLKLHRETKELPVYALVIGKKGPTLMESAADAKSSMRFGAGQFTGSKVSMTQLALFLSNALARPVLDGTGLMGTYDFKLQWTPDAGQLPGLGGFGPGPDAPPPSDPNGPSIFTAVQEQLGLKLESQKGPIEILVLDHAAKPSEN